MRPAALGLAMAAAVSACLGELRFTPPPPWVRVLVDPQISIALDSSRLVVHRGIAIVWLRIDLARPDPWPGDSTRRYSRLQLNMLVDCARRRVRDDSMALGDTTTDSLESSPVTGSHWHPFSAEPLTRNVLDPVCRTLRTLAPGGELHAGRTALLPSASGRAGNPSRPARARG